MNYLYQTDDVKIKEVKELLPPIAHLYNLPISEAASGLVHRTRHEIADLILKRHWNMPKNFCRSVKNMSKSY